MAAKKKSPKKSQERNLTRELAALLTKTLLPDLEARAKEPSVARALAAQYDSDRNHTSDTLAEWITRTLEQVAVAWILSCVFIRTLEDRGYLTHSRLAGDGAIDSEHIFFDLFPSLTQRDYLLAVFSELSHMPGGEDVLGRGHNPAWRLAPSTEVVRALLAFFREADSEGQLVWTFAGEGTRFLGDLYQDVSEAVRDRYALLQTPEFVEEFILDLTLDPAIAEFGLEDVRLIDPTCGSGHFLLGAFKRLFEARQRKAPGVPAKEHATSSLAQIYGADINPYAAAIARFRLVLAYLQAAEVEKLNKAPRVSTNVVVADSLRFAANKQTLPFAAVAEDATAWGEGGWQLEQPREAQRVFGTRFHAVVGNPPYITCKDEKLRLEYREAYKSAAGKFALSAPFTERFFQLAIDNGYVGMINANSFMKREFGRALIEKVLPNYELTRVMDTAGAYIPGHGTPTVLLFGRQREPIADTIIAVQGKRGEPETPKQPEQGLVWASIRDHFGELGFENEYVSVAAMPRATFAKHPWSLGGGGATDLKDVLQQRATKCLHEIVDSIGFMSISGEDEAYVASSAVFVRHRLPFRSFGVGEVVRDWTLQDGDSILFPYDDGWRPKLEEHTERWLWPYKARLCQRLMFGKTQLEAGFNWFEYRHVGRDKLRSQLSIAFAEVATHNHFILDRGDKVFKQTAPIIKLPEGTTEDDHLALLAYLNSSTVDFYIRQIAHNKGAQGINEGIKSEAWEQFLARNASAIGSIPLPRGWESLSHLGRQLDALAAARSATRPRALGLEDLGDERRAEMKRSEESTILGRMVAIQEQLDWEVYRLFGLTDKTWSEQRTHIEPGHRAFERALVQSGANTRWFGSNGYSRPAADVDQFDLSSQVQLVERPETKRRWTRTAWTSEVDQVLRERVLEKLETLIASSVSITSSARLATSLAGSQETQPLLHHSSVGLDVLTEHLASAAVPFVAPLRLSDTGLGKRAMWERSWELQRLVDAGVHQDVPIPPRYDSKDYRSAAFWRLRGKLDVPKERFISYPGAEKDDDPTPLFGWAGWNHLQQATALAGLFHERKTEDGWPADRLVPLLAGLLELVPWLKQWHNEPNDELGGDGPGDWYERYVEAESRSLGKSLQDLRDWRPATGRKKAK